MSENNKTEEFLKKLAPCIEGGDLDACVEEAVRVSREMGVGAEELLGLFAKAEMAYVLALAAAQGLEEEKKVFAYYNAGLTAQHLKKNENAEKYYKKAIEANPKYAAAHINYAVLLKGLNRRGEAEEQYKKAIEADPSDAMAHSNYAILLREKSLFYEAEKEVRIALQIQPNNPYELGIYGDILADEDYLEEAIKEYQKALKKSDFMKPSVTSEIRNNLGWAYALLKQYTRAKKEFEEAIKLDPQNVKAIRNLRAIRKVKSEPISKIQKYLAFALFIVVSATWYLFLNKIISENVFAAQSTFLIAILIFILYSPQLGKFKAGPIEFEMSTEHKSQTAEAISKIERSL